MRHRSATALLMVLSVGSTQDAQADDCQSLKGVFRALVTNPESISRGEDTQWNKDIDMRNWRKYIPTVNLAGSRRCRLDAELMEDQRATLTNADSIAYECDWDTSTRQESMSLAKSISDAAGECFSLSPELMKESARSKNDVRYQLRDEVSTNRGRARFRIMVRSKELESSFATGEAQLKFEMSVTYIDEK